MRRLSILTSVLILAFIGLFSTSQQSVIRAQDGTPTADHSLVGAWLVTISSTGENAGAVLPAQQTSLVSFFADGNLLVANAGQLPLLPPGSGLFFTGGHGQWTATGTDTVDATFVFLVIDQTGGVSSANYGTMTVTLDASGNTLAGDLTINAISENGNPTGSQAGTIEAVRIKAGPVSTPEAG